MSNSAQHTVMDADTVADLLGVSRRQLTNYINNNDLPCSGERKTLTFVWRDVLEWYVDYRKSIDKRFGSDDPESEMDPDEDDDEPRPGKKDNLQQATLRKVRADAHLKELTLARQRGQVIVIADARERLDRMMGNLRAKLLNLPPKLSARLEGPKSRTEREAILVSEMDALCREIATGAIVDQTPEEEAADDPVE